MKRDALWLCEWLSTVKEIQRYERKSLTRAAASQSVSYPTQIALQNCLQLIEPETLLRRFSHVLRIGISRSPVPRISRTSVLLRHL
ncbi:unnamed protein product [Periconia digitata]|uniref:Uncharacterized protein n=1 Tax=Periconia digitata TaxID=1303443 RepID=A0A9W4UCR8_9PLEO|nr:unnamed protein product [Periconia digitata]